MSALMFLDVTHTEKIYRKSVKHGHYIYSADEVRNILMPHIQGKTAISRRILGDRLREDFTAQEVHSILCSAVKRGMLIPTKRAGRHTVLYDIPTTVPHSLHYKGNVRKQVLRREIMDNRERILKAIGREDLLEVS